MVNYGDVNEVNDQNTPPESDNQGIREPNQNDINLNQDEILSHFQEVTGNINSSSFFYISIQM